MRIVFIVGIALVMPFFVEAQQYDNNWKMMWGLGTFNFDNNSYNLIYNGLDTSKYLPYWRANTSISDSAGNLQWYTNGSKIMNRNAQVMQGGDSINYDYYTYRYYYIYTSGHYAPYGCIGLPYPNKPNHWALVYNFHYTPQNSSTIINQVKYSEIDMNANGGLGAVIAKDVHAGNNSSTNNKYSYGITACKHANGKDWWIVNTDWIKYCYNIFLLDSSGINFKNKYCISSDTFQHINPLTFSTDGRLLISATKKDVNGTTPNQNHAIMIMNFDRCTGAISLKERISTDYMYNTENLTPWFPPEHPTYERDGDLTGVAVSPNSRYLYVVNTVRIYQYDLQASTIANSRVKVAQFDGHKDTTGLGSWSTFYLTQIAPDGKIYISNGGQSRYMHVIDQPNEAGLACNVLPHSIFLPLNNYLTIPNYPNYRLGAQTEQCITGVQSVIPTEGRNLVLYPNPAHDVIHITITPSGSEESPTNNPNGISPYGVNDDENLSIIIYNTEGQAMQLSPSLPVIPSGNDESLTDNNTYTINIARLPKGLYFLKIGNNSAKFVKQ